MKITISTESIQPIWRNTLERAEASIVSILGLISCSRSGTVSARRAMYRKRVGAATRKSDYFVCVAQGSLEAITVARPILPTTTGAVG